jgi:hypothetical protein
VILLCFQSSFFTGFVMNYSFYASMAKLEFTFGLRSLGLAWLGIPRRL